MMLGVLMAWGDTISDVVVIGGRWCRSLPHDAGEEGMTYYIRRCRARQSTLFGESWSQFAAQAPSFRPAMKQQQKNRKWKLF